jgi:hypothetical protein
MNKMVNGRKEDITRMLPIDARLKDMRLILVDPRYRQDPVYLLNSTGDIVREWEYIPWLGEVDDACKEVIGGQQRAAIF